MTTQIIIFGQLTDITGDSLTFDNVPDTNTLVQELHNRFPLLAKAKYVIAVDKKLVQSNTPLSSESTVALLPPFSGG
jgi:molybdopterin converting factor small subunit